MTNFAKSDNFGKFNFDKSSNFDRVFLISLEIVNANNLLNYFGYLRKTMIIKKLLYIKSTKDFLQLKFNLRYVVENFKKYEKKLRE